MHMDGRQAAGKTLTTQEMQQDDRIAATGEADTEALIRCQAIGEKIADLARQIN